MGTESVSYRFEPAETGVVELVDWLLLHGAINGDRQGTFIVAGADYWIDLLVRHDGPRAVVVQFRVAITNPTSVVEILYALISQLRARFGGRMTDVVGRILEDENTLSVLREDFSSNRTRFTEIYGDVVLPVSADQVFARLRAAEGHSG